MAKSKHHRYPVAQYGRKDNNSEVEVDAKRHDLWSQLFTGDMTPEQIVDEINRIWIMPSHYIVLKKR